MQEGACQVRRIGAILAADLIGRVPSCQLQNEVPQPSGIHRARCRGVGGLPRRFQPRSQLGLPVQNFGDLRTLKLSWVRRSRARTLDPAGDVLLVERCTAIAWRADPHGGRVLRVRLVEQNTGGDVISREGRRRHRSSGNRRAKETKLVGAIAFGASFEALKEALATEQANRHKLEKERDSLKREIEALSGDPIDPAKVQKLLGDFRLLYEAATDEERGERLKLLIARIDFHGKNADVAVTFRGDVKLTAPVRSYAVE